MTPTDPQLSHPLRRRQLATTSQATSLKMPPPTAASHHHFYSTLVAILSLSQLAQCASTSAHLSSSSNLSLSDELASGANLEAPPLVSVDETFTPAGELHFGAKVALCLLTGTVALVAVATLVDHQTSEHPKPHAHRRRAGAKSWQDSSATNGHRLLFGSKREPSGLRDYRSLSMSSSCSSSLFCYTNSVASSAAHLGGPPAPADTFAHAAQSILNDCLPPVTTAALHQHYDSNLELHFMQQQQQQQATSDVNNKSLTLNLTAAGGPFCEENNKPDASFLQPAAVACNHLDSRPASAELVDANGARQQRGRRAELASLASQILFAFSLRQSARQIFGAVSCCEEARRCASSDKWASDGAAPTLTLVAGEQNKSSSHKISCEARREAVAGGGCGCAAAKTDDLRRASCQPATASKANSSNTSNNNDKTTTTTSTSTSTSTSGLHESIDSLHGLRFLSMIWVIVIHSYNFALRWMFFSNASTLDSIYKSAASQLIANGSFACDSFFFAGGFLLPYSTFVPDPPARRAPTTNEHQESGSMRTSGYETTPATARNNLANNEQATVIGAGSCASHQQVAPTAGAGGRLESGAWCCSCASCSSFSLMASPSPCCCCAVCCCSCCCCYCAQQQQQLHGCARVGLVDAASAGAGNQVHARASAADSIAPPRPCRAADSGPHGGLQRACCTHWPARQKQAASSSQHQTTTEREQNTNELEEGATGASSKSGGSRQQQQPLRVKRILANILHRYARMMPLMMAIIGLCANLLRYLGDGPLWADSTLMYDGWCRKNWWINAMFLHNFLKRENMCLSHSWYSAVDLQLFLVGQLVLFVLSRSRRAGLGLLLLLIGCSQVITMSLTLAHQLPAVPLVSSVDEQTMNLYYGEIYIKPYCRASPYLIGLLLAYLMRTTRLEQLQLRKWQVGAGWTLSLGAFAGIILAMKPAMNGRSLSGLESALYSGLSRPLWALATGWMIFACITKRGGLVARILGARCFLPLSKLTYPAFLIHPIVMALFYGSRQSSFHFSHYLMLYLILGNIVITYACAFILAALFELPMLSVERAISRRLFGSTASSSTSPKAHNNNNNNNNNRSKLQSREERANKVDTSATNAQ